MTPATNVLHFHCQSCGSLLTVPMEMAGVTGPCPHCRATITSPTAPVSTTAVLQPAAMTAAVPAASRPPDPAVAAWTPPAPATMNPLPHGSGMTGAAWPPATSPSTAAAHPVMDRLLQGQMPAGRQAPDYATPPYQHRSPGPARRRGMSSRDQNRRGAMWAALFMGMLALAGTTWFFREQLVTAWRTYTLKQEESENPEPSGQTVAAPATPPGQGAPPPAPDAGFNPTAAPPQTVTPKAPEPATVPAAVPPKPPAGGGLVEVAPTTPASGPPVNIAVAPAAPVEPVLQGITEAAQPGLDALRKFFAAPTWETRLPYVQAADAMKPLMEQYYKSNPDGPIPVAHIQLIRHDKSPETGPQHCVFQVSGGGIKQPLPIMVEEDGSSGWKVDWLTFTEFKDNLLARFMEGPQPEPARFPVFMRRAHYFDDDVPALDRKTCFQISPPMPGNMWDVFALKGTPLARELDRQLGWDVSQAAAVVELQWRKEDRYQWIELTAVPQMNWRNVEAPVAKAVPVEEVAPAASAKR